MVRTSEKPCHSKEPHNVPPKSQIEKERGTLGLTRSLDDAIAIAASERGKGSTVRSIPSVDKVSPETWTTSSSPSFFLPVNSAVVALVRVPNPDIVCLRRLVLPERCDLRARTRLVLPTFSERHIQIHEDIDQSIVSGYGKLMSECELQFVEGQIRETAV